MQRINGANTVVTPTLKSTGHARPKMKRTSPKRKRRAISMTDRIIPKLTFERVVREILGKQSTSMRIKRSAVNMLHEETENLLHKMFTYIKSVSDSHGTSLITLGHMKLVYALTRIKGPPPPAGEADHVIPLSVDVVDMT
jgi:histone H3/H4